MTKFVKENFAYHGGYLTYDGKFVARFKYRGSPIKMGAFKAFLIKHVGVEEYFADLDAGISPLPAIEARGFTWTTRDGKTYPLPA